MLEMIWKPTLYGFDTCKEFAEAFRLNSDDLILSNAYIYEPYFCLLYTSPSPRDPKTSRMPSSA